MQQFMPNYVHNAIGVLAANKITQIRFDSIAFGYSTIKKYSMVFAEFVSVLCTFPT